MVRAGSPLAANRVFTFDKNNKVHHCNYFAQKETIAQIRTWLNV